MAGETFDASRPTIRELIDASSFGTREAKRLREEGQRAVAPDLTGMPQEQADWDGDGPEAGEVPDPN